MSHKWIIFKERIWSAVQTSGYGYGSTSAQPDYLPAPLIPSLATWWGGLQGRYLGSQTIGALLMQTKTPKFQMAQFPNLEGFFLQSQHFQVCLVSFSLQMIRTNTLCFIFHYYCFLLGFCFMTQFRIWELCSELEWHKIPKSSSKWRIFLLSKTLFIVGCPFCSQRGARSYYDIVLSYVFNLDVKLGLAWN